MPKSAKQKNHGYSSKVEVIGFGLKETCQMLTKPGGADLYVEKC